MTRIKGALIGAILAIAAIAGLHSPRTGVAVTLLSLFLALTACVYLGALLVQPQKRGIVLSEFAVGAAVFLCAVLGALVSTIWLAVGYSIHGLWDWAHDAGMVATKVFKWFPPACAIFDFIIAGFVVFYVA